MASLLSQVCGVDKQFGQDKCTYILCTNIVLIFEMTLFFLRTDGKTFLRLSTRYPCGRFWSAGAFELALYASDILTNPLESLCEALAIVAAGSSARVLWYLEPAECWFDFENQAEEVVLTSTERPSRNRLPTQVFQVSGTSKEALRPLYQALTQFAAHAYSEVHWPTLAKDRLAQLGELLKNSR